MSSATYTTISSVLFIAGIVLVVVAIFLYFKLDIYKVSSELNGRIYKRQAKKLKKKYTPNVEGPTTGSFYNNSLSEFSGSTTGTTGHFGNTPYASATTGNFNFTEQGIDVSDIALFDQEEYQTGVLDDDDDLAEATVAVNRYHILTIVEESSNVKFRF